MPKSDDAWLEDQEDEALEDHATNVLRARLQAMETENRRLGKLLGLVEGFHSGSSSQAPKWVTPKGKPKTGTGVANLQFSDLHFDELVNPKEVGFLNAYDREIAELRLKRWADKCCELGQRYKHNWDGAIAWWGGDMLSGAIHEELRETNCDVLPGTLMHYAPLVAAAFGQIVDFYGKLYVPCVTGNHGRLTEKKQFKRRGRASWDWLFSKIVAEYFKKDDRVTFEIAEGSCLFVPVYDTHGYLTHGDEAGGGSGWSGVWTPLNTIHRKGLELASVQDKRLAFSVIGHWHQTCLAHQRGISCNGSMKGYDEFAMGLRLKPEAAMQNFWVHTPEHGVVLAAPVFLQDRKAEGW